MKKGKLEKVTEERDYYKSEFEKLKALQDNMRRVLLQAREDFRSLRLFEDGDSDSDFKSKIEHK